MPAGDRTGPWGFGPRTGRGMGYCAGYPAPGYMSPGLRFGFGRGFGRGLGRGFGRGRGSWRSRFGGFWGYPLPGFTTPDDPWGAAELTPQQELDFLKAEAQQLQDDMSAIEQRIQELEREKK